MTRKSKLLSALNAHKGRNYELERQKKLQKQAKKRKRTKVASINAENASLGGVTMKSNGNEGQADEQSSGWESDKIEEEINHFKKLDALDDSNSDESSENDIDEDVYLIESGGGNAKADAVRGGQGVIVSDGAEKITSTLSSVRRLSRTPDSAESPSSGGSLPLSDLSDLSDNEKADIIPHQRLTINNTSALLRAHTSIALSPSLPFSTTQSLVSPTQIHIPDVHDDLNRELAFYKQSVDAANEGRRLLLKEGVPFTRPNDYFAEMVKSDEHMGKIKTKMTEAAADKKAAAEARKQRDLRKFGKQVQVAKLQERAKEKRETLDMIKVLKRKRKDADTGTAHEEDLFDVALEDANTADKAVRSARRDGKGMSRDKRQKRDAKYGFGGKKRFAKSGDAASTGDLSGFSAKKMKGGGARKGPQRLGKSRRAKR